MDPLRAASISLKIALIVKATGEGDQSLMTFPETANMSMKPEV